MNIETKIKKIKKENLIIQCRCGYIISPYEYYYARYDYGCPRCKNSFSNFNFK